ncbi:MAG: TolC family protein [Hymenobacteraceae bacterium]|nr:TolC family protein [Hymenobacteraceae bacterium]MDX5395006.1 TolC family protein [Hymenobacteraceae bacterium]MDX5442702.1 TolC family protein [Hymenobacteraceae bacterium]MDX5511039.1 TolC family protein [Hymenobacteraceae bacterium]
MKKIIKIGLVAALLGPFGLLKGQAQQAPQALSLQQSIDYALQNQPNVKNARIDTEIAKAKVGEIRSAGLPQINAGAEIGDNFIQQKNFLPAEFFGGEPGTFQPVTFTPQYSGNASLTGSQLLFDGSYLIGLKAASTYTQLSKKTETQTEIDVAEQVSKAYYGVLVNRERMTLLDQNLSRLDTLLKQTEAMFNEGFAEKLDVDRLKVSYNNLMVEKQKTERLLELSQDLLKFQMGMPQSETLVLTDKLADVEVDMAKTNISDFNYSNRIEYSILETQRDLALLDIKNKKAGYLPRLSLNGRYGALAANNDFSNITKLNGDNWLSFGYVGLGIQVPVFDGLRKHYQVQQAKLTLDKTKVGFTALENSIDLQLQKASTDLTNALAVLDNQQRNLELAEDIARVTKIKFQEGVGTNLEVVTAETSLKEAQVNYYAALYDAMIAKVDLDKATGTLLKK